MLDRLRKTISSFCRQEEKTIPSSHRYIQNILSYPKKLLTSSAQSLSNNNTAGLLKLLFSLNLFDFLPKTEAGMIYVLAVAKQINYALMFDTSGPLKSLPTHLLDSCPNITILPTSDLNYTEFFSTGCTGNEGGDKHLTMLIALCKNMTNNTQFLVDCTQDLVKKINDSCDQDGLENFAFYLYSSLGGLLFLVFLYYCIKPLCTKNHEETPTPNRSLHGIEAIEYHSEEKKSIASQSTPEPAASQNETHSISNKSEKKPEPLLTEFSFMVNPHSQSPKSVTRSENHLSNSRLDNKHIPLNTLIYNNESPRPYTKKMDIEKLKLPKLEIDQEKRCLTP